MDVTTSMFSVEKTNYTTNGTFEYQKSKQKSDGSMAGQRASTQMPKQQATRGRQSEQQLKDVSGKTERAAPCVARTAEALSKTSCSGELQGRIIELQKTRTSS